MFGGCYVRETNPVSSGDTTGSHNLLVNAIANGNFTITNVKFGNQSARQIAAGKIVNTGTLLLNHTGDSGAVDAFCISAGEELKEIDLSDDADELDKPEILDDGSFDDEEEILENDPEDTVLPEPVIEGEVCDIND